MERQCRVLSKLVIFNVVLLIKVLISQLWILHFPLNTPTSVRRTGEIRQLQLLILKLCTKQKSADFCLVCRSRVISFTFNKAQVFERASNNKRQNNYKLKKMKKRNSWIKFLVLMTIISHRSQKQVNVSLSVLEK